MGPVADARQRSNPSCRLIDILTREERDVTMAELLAALGGQGVAHADRDKPYWIEHAPGRVYQIVEPRMPTSQPNDAHAAGRANIRGARNLIDQRDELGSRRVPLRHAPLVLQERRPRRSAGTRPVATGTLQKIR